MLLSKSFFSVRSSAISAAMSASLRDTGWSASQAHLLPPKMPPMLLSTPVAPAVPIAPRTVFSAPCPLDVYSCSIKISSKNIFARPSRTLLEVADAICPLPSILGKIFLKRVLTIIKCSSIMHSIEYLFSRNILSLFTKKSISTFAILGGKYAFACRQNCLLIRHIYPHFRQICHTNYERITPMYRDRIDELRKEKGITPKQLADLSGVSNDTLSRIHRPENPEKDSPRIITLENICKVFGIELWELFYTGTTSPVAMQAEITALKTERDSFIAEIATLKSERDSLIADLAVQKEKNEQASAKIDELKDKLIEVLTSSK